jgi:hypothetical protein
VANLSPSFKRRKMEKEEATHFFCCLIGLRRFLLTSEPEFLNFSGAQESIPRNQFRQAEQPGGPVRQPYSYSVPGPQRLFKNSSTDITEGAAPYHFSGLLFLPYVSRVACG